MTANFRRHAGVTTLAVWVVLGFCSTSHAKTLYVDAATGSDATTYAANGPSAPWRSIGRAAWGSTSRTAPNAAEAARAGDIVMVAGGTYTTTVSVGSRWSAVYNPVNSGTLDSPITFRCVGQCLLGAPNANSPVIGASGSSYIKWHADVTQGHAWRINAYGPQTGTATSTQVNTSPDTGPVVCHDTSGCWIEGTEIDGGPQTDYTDNWNAIRFENCRSCTIRNNSIRNFWNQSRSINSTAVTLYGSPNALVEHNYATDVGTGLIFKDHGSTLPQNGVRVRFNRFEATDRCVAWSTSGEDRNYVYQNICTNSRNGLHITGGGLTNDWIFNNTFNNISSDVVYLASNSSVGGRFWNNIVYGTQWVILLNVTSMPADTGVDFEHNVYHQYAQFYTGSDGNRTFDSYKTAYRTQDQAPTASVSADPLFVARTSGDLRLCAGAGVPVASCTRASPAMGLGVDLYDLDGDGSTTDAIPAGAYVNNTEIIGIAASGGPSRPQPPQDVGVE